MTEKCISSFSDSEWKDIKLALKEAVVEFIDRGNSNRDGVFRIEEDVEGIDPLLWLKGQKSDHRLFFADRDKELITSGIGISADLRGECSEVHQKIDRVLTNSSSDVKFYGGEAFPSYESSEEWKDYGERRYIVPLFELGIREGQGFFACNIPAVPDKSTILKQLDSMVLKGAYDTDIPELETSSSTPDYENWCSGINSSLRNFRLGCYEKIVLSVRRELKFKTAPDPFYIMRELLKLPNSRYHFLFDFCGTVFAGSSPERLYLRRGDRILSEAVAGTVSRGGNPDEDSELGFRLLTSDKDVREHGFVVRAVKEQLEKICSNVTVSVDNQLLKLSEGQHIKRMIRAELNQDCSESDIIEALHPTPAVGGYPADTFLKDIYRFESYSRGWYSGAIGYRSWEKTDYAVGIRSMMLRDRDLFLYGGVGVVEGSQAESEWEESIMKLRNILEILRIEKL